jgi:uncharacterized protein (DUF305 family)
MRALLVGALAATLLTGCSGEDKPAAGPEATMLAPGRPGEANKTVTSGPTQQPEPAETDVNFMRMMILHHEQAVEMSSLAPERAAGAKVKSLASRIQVAQAGEIAAMRSWLRRNKKLPATGHQHAMPGLVSPDEMAGLKKARAADFDERFLTLMIKHHEGALTMADEVLAKGTDMTANQFAKDVIATQRAEINRMRDLM